MIAWLVKKLGISQLAAELIGIGLLVALVFYGGYHTRTLIYEAGELGAVKKQLSEQQATDKAQFDHDLAVAKSKAIIEKMNNKLNEDVDATMLKTPIPKCDITPERVVLINRAATRN